LRNSQALSKARIENQDDEPLGNAFDIAWLTVVCIQKKEMKAGKKPRTRVGVNNRRQKNNSAGKAG
jgi:hypothetical protein